MPAPEEEPTKVKTPTTKHPTEAKGPTMQEEDKNHPPPSKLTRHPPGCPPHLTWTPGPEPPNPKGARATKHCHPDHQWNDSKEAFPTGHYYT